MKNQGKREERSEYISMYVSPTVKKQWEGARDNAKLQEEIIKMHITSESSWIESELKEMDEMTIKYKAKLIGIKDAFSQAQDSYQEEVEAIWEKANQTFSKVNTITDSLARKSEEALISINGLSNGIRFINVERLERLLVVIDKYNALGKEEKGLINALINKEQ